MNNGSISIGMTKAAQNIPVTGILPFNKEDALSYLRTANEFIESGANRGGFIEPSSLYFKQCKYTVKLPIKHRARAIDTIMVVNYVHHKSGIEYATLVHAIFPETTPHCDIVFHILSAIKQNKEMLKNKITTIVPLNDYYRASSYEWIEPAHLDEGVDRIYSDLLNLMKQD
jgi:hypothetical protein